MAFVKANFFQHSLNQFAPNRVRGDYKDWGLNAQVLEVQIDSTQATALLPGDPVSIVATSTGKLKVVAATASTPVLGYIIFNPKHKEYVAGDICSVLCDGGVMYCGTTETINAGATVYYKVADGSVTTTSTNNIKMGVMFEKSTSSTDGTLVAVEIRRPAI